MYAQAMATPGMSQSAAMRISGYAESGQNKQMLRNPHILKLIEAERAAYAKASQMTRRRVVDGFLRAVEIADATSDSIAMTAGWREIGRMCGFYAPQVVKHEVSFDASTLKQRLESMTEEQLMRLADENGNLEDAPAILEGDFQLIGHEPAAAGTSESSPGSDNLEHDLRKVD